MPGDQDHHELARLREAERFRDECGVVGVLGHPEAAKAVEEAIETVLAEPSLHTPDMGGKATTADLGGAIAEALG